MQNITNETALLLLGKYHPELLKQLHFVFNDASSVSEVKALQSLIETAISEILRDKVSKSIETNGQLQLPTPYPVTYGIIQPDARYTTQELCDRMGANWRARIATARANPKVLPSQKTGRNGFAYEGADVIRWLKGLEK